MLKEFIDKFYLERQQDKAQTHFYITDAGKCPRAIFFKFKKAPKRELEARILRMFDHGDYIHQLIMKSLFGTRKVRVVAAEIDMPPQEMISGRADAIVSLNNELYVLDIKSINSLIFDKLTAPKEDNVNQLQLYLHFFQVPKGILLYVSKDNQDIKEFVVNYNRDLCLKLLSELKDLKNKIDSDVIPSPLSKWPDDWQCQYCQFKEICDIIGRNELKWSEFKNKVASQGETQ